MSVCASPIGRNWLRKKLDVIQDNGHRKKGQGEFKKGKGKKKTAQGVIIMLETSSQK